METQKTVKPSAPYSISRSVGGDMANKNTEYEIFVQSIYQYLLKAQGLETIKVERDVDLIGRSRQSHQIDVYWEYKIGGVSHRVAIECKNYKSTITVGKVRDFYGVLADVPNLQGVMVTRVSYQSGTVRFAESYGIGLKIIREVQDNDWEGRVRGIHMELIAVSAEVTNTAFDLDQNWLNNEMPGASPKLIIAFIREIQQNPLLFNDEPTGKALAAKINECFNLLGVMSIDDDEIHQQSFDLRGYAVEIEDKPPLRLSKITLDFRRKESAPINIISKSAAEHIVRDAISGELQFVDEDGVISGDMDD